jgi:lipopolysaccharide transport system permease protein
MTTPRPLGMAPMRENLRELWEARYVLRQFVVRTLKVRYKNSALGFCWSIVPPLLQVFVFTFMFRQVLNVKAENYSAYLLVGMIPWTFFQSAVLDASNSLKDNLPLIRKVYLPREVIPLSQVVSNFIHFMLAWVVYFVAFAIVARLLGLGIPLLPSLLWFPVITFFLVLFTTGISLWMAALHMFYDDIKFILQNVFQLLYFLIPVLYPADNVKYAGVMQQFPWLYTLYMVNPITAFINAYRKTILEPLSPSAFNERLSPNLPPVPLDYPTLGIACLFSVLVACGGYWYFCRRKWLFVEWK